MSRVQNLPCGLERELNRILELKDIMIKNIKLGHIEQIMLLKKFANEKIVQKHYPEFSIKYKRG